MADPTLLIGGALLLYLFGGKKKAQKVTKTPPKTVPGKRPVHPGGDITGPKGRKPQIFGGGKDPKQKPPANLAPTALWVSDDCKNVVFGDGLGYKWWDAIGLKAAEDYAAANYHDSYEIARSIISGIAPCAMEFPVSADGFNDMEIEFKREMFLRKFMEVYYLIELIAANVAGEVLVQEEYTIELDDDCDTVFVGDKWVNPVAGRMIRFYLDYTYPNETNYMDHEERFFPWEGHEVKEKYTNWQDNVVTAVINRVTPFCAYEIIEAFKKEPWSAITYFSTRSGLKALYDELYTLVDEIDESRPSAPFNPEWEK